MEIRVIRHGALVEGRAAPIVHRLEGEMVEAVGQQALSEVSMLLDRSIRHPTPYYETQIQHERRTEELHSVNDRGIIYGPWLEGTSRRNATTRFKGYASFRRATQRVQSQVPQIVGRIVNQLVRELS